MDVGFYFVGFVFFFCRVACFLAFVGQVKSRTKVSKTSWLWKTWMEKSDSPHISHIPTISAGWDKWQFFVAISHMFLILPSYTCVRVCVYRPLLEPIESLLQMLLLWDPAARGGKLDPDTNKPYCYTILQNILNMKVKDLIFCWHFQLKECLSFVTNQELIR